MIKKKRNREKFGNGEYMGKLMTFIKNPVYFITSAASKGWLDWIRKRVL